MEENHSGQFGGYFAGKSLYKSLAQHYWWKGMFRDAHLHCHGCLPCAAYQGSGPKARPHLQSIPVGGSFQHVGVDVFKMLQTTQENQYIMVFIDYLTKWVEVYPTANQTSETIARLLIDHIICRHGVPAELLPHDSSGESPFFPPVWDTHCPTETALCQLLSPCKVDIDNNRLVRK